MSYDMDDAMALFERPSDGPTDEDQESEPAPPKQRNLFALTGTAASFVPLVGLGLSVYGFVWSKTRDGLGRTLALSGVALSLVFGGVEIYVGTTAPLFDSGCLGANSPASRLRAIQAAPGGDLTLLANEMASIHSDLDSAADEADSAAVRVRIQSVANDVNALGNDFLLAQRSGDTTPLFSDEMKLETDGNAADSYCHSL